MPERITLNDGTVLNGTVLENGDGRIIFVYITGMSILEGVLLFSDQDRIRILNVYNHGSENRYEGYTEICSVSNEYGNCNLVMRKAEANA